MEQNSLTVIVKIKPEQLESLRLLLTEIGQDIEANPYVRFRDSPSTHFARWVILDGGHSPGPRLLFSSYFDGPYEGYVRELVEGIGPGMELIWNKCTAYPPGASQDPIRFAEFLRAHSVGEPHAFFVAYRGVPVAQILRNQRAREMLEQLLDHRRAGPWLTQLSELLPGVSHTFKQIGGPFTLPEGDSAVARLIGRIVGVRRGASPTRKYTVDDSRRQALLAAEDLIAQNQMTLITPIRQPRIYRRSLLRAVLAGTNAIARASFGPLAGVTSIHFCRWTIIDGGKCLLFESNYDGSWESYVDDFASFARVAPDAIWANCEDYPSGGCQDVDGFKGFLRKYQFPAQVFYSAYPAVTVRNILEDLQITSAVEQFLEQEEMEQFLSGSHRTGTKRSTARLSRTDLASPPRQVLGVEYRSDLRAALILNALHLFRGVSDLIGRLINTPHDR